MRRFTVPLCLLAAIASDATAQSVVVPNANAAARGTSGLNTLTRNAGNARTYMLGINATQLTGIPAGSIINGVSFRSYVGTANPASWPPADAGWADYEVQIGNAIPLASWTTTFLTNFAGPTTAARDNAMLITTGTYANDTTLPAPTPNTWGDFFWDFQTPFTYAGGDLGIYFTHPGSLVTTAMFVDVVSSNAAGGFVAYSGTGMNVATGVVASFSIARIHYGYGAACAGTTPGLPNLVQTANTTGGGLARFAIGNAPANAPAAYVFGAGRTALTLPNGCTLLTQPAVIVPTALDANGRFILDLRVPPGVVGMLNVQAVIVDIGAAGSYILTNGVELTAN